MRDVLTHLTSLPEVWIAKLVGAIAGSAISLAYVLPRGKREAAVRFLTGLSGGIVFGSPVGFWLAHYLAITEDLDEFELALMGAALASLSIWTALGLALRFSEGRYSAHPMDKTALMKGEEK